MSEEISSRRDTLGLDPERMAKCEALKSLKGEALLKELQQVTEKGWLKPRPFSKPMDQIERDIFRVLHHNLGNYWLHMGGTQALADAFGMTVNNVRNILILDSKTVAKGRENNSETSLLHGLLVLRRHFGFNINRR